MNKLIKNVEEVQNVTENTKNIEYVKSYWIYGFELESLADYVAIKKMFGISFELYMQTMYKPLKDLDKAVTLEYMDWSLQDERATQYDELVETWENTEPITISEFKDKYDNQKFIDRANEISDKDITNFYDAFSVFCEISYK
jgi:superfamily II helicase